MKPTLSGAPCARAGSGNAPARLAAAAPFRSSRRVAHVRILLIKSLPGCLPRCALAIASVVASWPREGKLADWRSAPKKALGIPRAFPMLAVQAGPGSILGLARLAHVALRIELQAKLIDQIELGLEEIDVAFLVCHQCLEQVARGIILDACAVGRGFLIERARAELGLEIDFEDFLDVLPDVQGIEHLHVGKALKKDDAVDEFVGVHHFLDRFLAPFLGELV